ncbi:MAG: hypothetical protein ACKKMP_03580 [Candidatus Nealsonbacteria bacterium]
MKKQKNDQSIKKLESIEEKLDTIIRILGLQVGTDIDKSLTERVGLLNLAGVDNKTIAKILRTKPSIVRALISQFSRKK